MFDISAFLDRAKAGAGNVSDYRLAQLIGVSQPTISLYRTGARMPATLVIERLCDYSGDDKDHVIACVQSMRAANDEEAAVWQRIADRLRRSSPLIVSGFAAAAFSVLAGLGLMPGPERRALRCGQRGTGRAGPCPGARRWACGASCAA